MYRARRRGGRRDAELLAIAWHERHGTGVVTYNDLAALCDENGLFSEILKSAGVVNARVVLAHAVALVEAKMAGSLPGREPQESAASWRGS